MPQSADFWDADIVLVGENRFSLWLLLLMEAFLNIRLVQGQDNRLTFYLQNDLEYAPSACPVGEKHTGEVTEACLGVFAFPNPYNIRREVLIFWGTQPLFHDCLISPLVLDLLEKARDAREKGLCSGGWQFVISPSLERNQEMTMEYVGTGDFLNRKKGFSDRSVVPIELRPTAPPFQKIVPDLRLRKKPEDRRMLDISLLLDLTDIQEEVKRRLRNWGAPEFLFDIDKVYQESARENVGLHVTLYEFAHHTGGCWISEEEKYKLFSNLHEQTEIELSTQVLPLTIRLLHAELLPDTIFLYTDFSLQSGRDKENFPARTLTRIRKTCNQLADQDRKMFNLRRMPFPYHCTLWRFVEDFSMQVNELEQIRQFVKSTKGKILGEFKVESIILTMAEAEPFDNVISRKIELRQS